MTSYPITPIGKPRMTQRDKYRPVHKRYFQWCEGVRMLDIQLPVHGAHVIFIIPMPPSWSKKKKHNMCAQPHEQTPDIDNLFKALADAIYKNDSHISDVRLTKLWGYEGAIIIK